MSAVTSVSSDQFQAEVLDSTVPVVVDFWAPWCGPCRVVGPEVEKIAAAMGDRVKVVKVNVDEAQEVAMRYGIMSIPTIVKFERGAVVGQVVGAMNAAALTKQLGLEG